MRMLLLLQQLSQSVSRPTKVKQMAHFVSAYTVVQMLYLCSIQDVRDLGLVA